MQSKFLKLGNFIATLLAVLTGLLLYWLMTMYLAVPLLRMNGRLASDGFDALLNRSFLAAAYFFSLGFLLFLYLIGLSFVMLYVSVVPYLVLRKLRQKWQARTIAPLTEADLRQSMLRGMGQPMSARVIASSTHPPVPIARRLSDLARLHEAEAIARKVEERQTKPE